jgi:hypothetical protein
MYQYLCKPEPYDPQFKAFNRLETVAYPFGLFTGGFFRETVRHEFEHCEKRILQTPRNTKACAGGFTCPLAPTHFLTESILTMTIQR